ncbi:2-oxoglutarate-acceptor oxidoreductase subunit OorB [compost metagenome]
MGEAIDNMNWIDEITVGKRKYDAMSEEERKGLYPTGVLVEKEQEEYCDLYDKIIDAAQGKGPKLTTKDFE